MADTYERAIEEARAGVEPLFNNYLTLPMEMLMPPGYTSLSSMKKTMAARAGIGLKRQTIEEMIELGTVVVGTPTMVRDKIQKMRDATNIGIFVALLQIGVMGDELARRNMQMYASEVMPHLK